MRISSLIARLEQYGLHVGDAVPGEDAPSVQDQPKLECGRNQTGTDDEFINGSIKKLDNSRSSELQWLEDQQLVSSRNAHASRKQEEKRLSSASTDVDDLNALNIIHIVDNDNTIEWDISCCESPLHSAVSDALLKRADGCSLLADSTICGDHFDECGLVCTVEPGNESPVFKKCWFCAPFNRKSVSI